MNKTPVEKINKNIRDAYSWAFLVRIVSWILISAVVFILGKLNVLDFDYRPLIFILLPLFLCFNFVFRLLFRKKTAEGYLTVLTIATDLIFTSLFVYFSGGFHSEFIFLYFIPIISSALISLRATIITILIAFVSYGGIVFLEKSYFINPIDKPEIDAEREAIIDVSLFISLAGMVGFQSYYFISKIRKKDEEILKFKNDFLFRTVHDLRAPGSAINFIAEKYKNISGKTDSNEIREDALRIKEITGQMLHLANNILSIAKGDVAEIVFKNESFGLSDVIREVAGEFKETAASKNIKINLNLGFAGMAIGDKGYVKEIFTNLIDNAIKYNKDNGVVDISAYKEGGFVKTTVRDSGVGISKDGLAKIFTPYFRESAEVSGNGLGLYIVKNFTEKMGGKAMVESEENKGTAVSVWFLADKNYDRS